MNLVGTLHVSFKQTDELEGLGYKLGFRFTSVQALVRARLEGQ